MADSRRWQARSAAQREDQFVRPPAFVDHHDSNPLSGEAVAWHGPDSHRHVAVAAALIVAAAAAAVALMMLVQTDVPSSGALGPSAAQSDSGAGLGSGDAGAIDPAPPVDVGNVTVPATPALPPLPTGPELP